MTDGTHRLNRRELLRGTAQGAVGIGLGATLGSITSDATALADSKRALRFAGPLRVSSENPRYLTDATGRVIYLAGANTWGNIQDGFEGDAWGYGFGNPYDYDAFLDGLVANNLNYARLWLYETAYLTYFQPFSSAAPDHPFPNPWRRTGPGVALDGRPKFDLTKFDQSYFDRLRQRAAMAGERGIYVSIMLFEGWSTVNYAGQNGWVGHPFNAANNINGINGDADGDGQGTETHTLLIPEITRLQQRYARKVIDTVNDLDNIFYEISNESPGLTDTGGAEPIAYEWQYHMIKLVKRHQARRGKRHPIYMSGVLSDDPARNQVLFASDAEVVAPGHTAAEDWLGDPLAVDGTKVVINETDHTGATTLPDDPAGARAWAWKAFTRGNNASLLVYAPDQPGFEAGQRALGDTRLYAQRVGLARMTPQGALTSTGHCLASPGHEYLVYQPAGGSFTIVLARGNYAVEWFNPTTRAISREAPVHSTGGTQSFAPPFNGDAVLYLRSRR